MANRFSFWDWLKELFHIDFTNRGKNPYTYQYDADYGATEEDLGTSSSSGVFGLPSFSSFAEMLKALASRLTGTALTPAEREASALQLQNQQMLNEEDFQRKIDFYERYESPQAIMNQYKSAGLNPALMYGGGASVSVSGGVGTGSASMPSAQMESIAGILSAISGASLRSQELAFERKMKERELDLEEERIGVQRNQSQAYSDYLRSQQAGQDITNLNLQRVFDLQAGEVRAKTNLLIDNLQTAEAQRVLLRNQVSESQARSSLIRVQTSIAGCDAAVRRQYNDIMVRSAQLQYDMMGVESKYQKRFLDDALERNQKELAHLFIENGLLGLERDNYKSNLNWEHGLGIARTVVTAAGAAIGGMIGMKSMRSPSMIQAPMPSDYMKYGLPMSDPLRAPMQYYGNR